MNNDLKPCPKCNTRPVQETRVEVLGGIQDGGFAVILRRYKCPVCGDAPGWRRYHYADSGWDRNIEAWNEYVEGKKRAMNNDLISREAAKEAVKYIPWCDWSAVGRTLDELEVVDAAPVVHGRWIHCAGKSNVWHCSECGGRIMYNQTRKTYNIKKTPVSEANKFCKHCGAKMDLKSDEEEDDVRKTEKRDQ